MIVLSPDRMRRYDEFAINKWGIPSAVLMENAGRSTYRLVKERHLFGCRRLTVCCGRGNNGGDGFVIARYAMRDGFDVEVLLIGDPAGVKGDAKLNMDLYQSLGGKTAVVRDGEAAVWEARLAGSDVIVDAIFGTGLATEVKGIERSVVEAINRAGKTVIAVDIPSGLDGLKGVPLGVAVQATHTYTYGHPKVGLLLHPGIGLRGRLTVVDIGLPASAESDVGVDGYLVDGEMLRSFYRPRLPYAHKGMFGNVGVIAGSTGKTGASVMTTQAALKIGAGLVTLATPASLNQIVATKLTEAMTLPVDDGGRGFFCDNSGEELKDFAVEKDLVVIGPGLGRHEETASLVRRLFVDLDMPFVIDADGINAFTGHLDLFKSRPARALLTPHPGEFARLTGRSPHEVNNDRLEMGRAFAKDYRVHLVLKGTPTVTFSPGGEAFINPTGGPALSKGGTGDVLTGFIGGLLAQGYSMTEAAVFGVYLHGYVADTWTETNSDMDLLAADLFSGLGKALRDIVNGTDRVYIERSL